MQTRVRQSLTTIAFFLVLGAVNAPAQQQKQQAAAAPPSKFKLMTSAYTEGSMIPTQYSCADPNAATPALQWSDAPTGTVSFAVILHDTDAAPGKNSMDVTHWIFWNVPGSSTSVGAGVKPDTSPDGIMQGKNVRNINGYQPPCPPPGANPHHYIFELYALDAKVDLPAGSARAELLKAMDGHVIGKATYVGIYGR